MSLEKKFNVGDRVMCTDNGALGVITSIDIDPIGVCDGYTVLFDDGEETWICVDMVVHSDEPTHDPKTAFLSELKGLLEKYDASINVGWNDGWQSDDREYPLIDMCIQIGNNPYAIGFDDVLAKSLTADNLMNYDKE